MSDFQLQRLGMVMEPEPGNPQEIEGVLNPGGFLLLGAAETTLNLTDSFQRRAVDGVSFYQKR